MSILEQKLELLHCLYDVFSDFVAERFQPVCAQRCSVCCTRDITATTLEAYELLKALKEAGRRDLIDRAMDIAAGDLFRPRVTTNAMAYACLTRQEPPVEEAPATSDPCPFLVDELCEAYERRPFSCRGMFSLIRCRPAGEAEVPPELISIVTVCWQIIEHLDVGGLYGNLLDLMKTLDDDARAFQYETGGQLIAAKLPPTRPLPGLLVPPEHDGLVREFLQALFQKECGGRPFRERMSDVRNSPF